jgi:formyltetrahydrofolate deformylase
MTNENRYILTLSCADVRGIVASVTGFLAEQDGFIIESAQFGDESTGQFFLRIEFATGPQTPDYEALQQRFQLQVAQRFSMQWQLHDKAQRTRVLVMVSKFGHCLNDLLHRYTSGLLPIEIPCVVSNHPDLQPIVEWHGIPFYHLPVTAENRPQQEAALMQIFSEYQTDLVVLARYMQILSSDLCEALTGRAINIHHSFLPSFKGANPYRQAFDRGVKLIGATAHYVTNQLDEGPIIEQEVARVDHTYTPEMLSAVGRDSECMVLARALKYHIEHRVLINGHKTVVFK